MFVPVDDLLGGCRTNADRPAHRYGFHVDPRFKDSGERRSDTREHDAPQDRDEDRQSDTGRIHQAVKQQNVHDDWSENRECERHVAIDQKQRARDHLQPRDEQEIFRNEHRSEELSRDSAGRRHRDEMQKSIQAEDQKDQTQKEPTHVS